MIEIIRSASIICASPHSGQATLRVAVGLSRSLSATIITLTPHLQRQVVTIVITVRKSYEEDTVPPTTFIPRNVVVLASIAEARETAEGSKA